MLARCVATLKPPPELTLSQWADRYRMLSAESSAEPGRWHTDKAPYQREIMDAIGDPHIRRVVIMCAAQLGKTELLLNILGYFMAYAPAPILVMQPTLDMGQTFSKDRLAPMIRDTPVLRGLVDVKSRYAGNTILKKNFPGGHITIVGANSATGLASRPIKGAQDDPVTRDIMVDSEGYLTTGRGLYYAAQVEIPARKYTETVTPAQETDAQAEGGENTEGMSRETVTRTPEPLDTDDVTLYLFAIDGIMIH